jgi:outer membrane protein assembly factor BamE (lipoprotein component of BamABCDE complex)
MRRRRWLGLLLVAALAAVGAALLRPTGPRPCRATFEQVREGMAREEVVATVGGPPGVYSDRPEWVPFFDQTYGMDEKWVAHDSTLRVYFSESGRASHVEVADPPPDDRSLVSRLRARLGL